jgi:hypothetical protein
MKREDQNADCTQAERAARAEIEKLLSGPLTDAEWAKQLKRLVGLVPIFETAS